MEISTRQVIDVTVVDLTGRLDSQASGRAYDELVRLAQSGTKKLLLNLDRLEFLSSAGLRGLLVAAKLLKGSHGLVQLCCAHGVVKQTLQLSGFTSLLPLHDSETEAVRSF
jgi:anti-sigma B factor antagonist